MLYQVTLSTENAAALAAARGLSRRRPVPRGAGHAARRRADRGAALRRAGHLHHRAVHARGPVRGHQP